MDERTQRIQAALATHGAELIDAKPLHGGACQEMFRVDASLGGTKQRFALRCDARESLPMSIRRSVEFAVVNAAVEAGVQTPAARWLTPNLLREGADGYLLDWAEGEAIGRRVVRNPELEAARAKLPEQLATSLGRLHRVTPREVTLPLPNLTEPPSTHAVKHLRAMLDAIPVALPAVELGLRWAQDHAPLNEEVVLVHGDFRTGNFLVTPGGLSAILDWEFSHWGSPYEDLSWISVRDWRFGKLDKPVGGFSPRAPFITAYEKISGRTVDAKHLLWWEIIGNLRWAVGSVYQGERYLSGKEQDLELIAIARRSVEMEFEALRLIRRGRL